MDSMTRHQCVLLVDTRTDTIEAMLHYADLNKQPVRIFFYLWLSALEMGLMEYFKRLNVPFDDWVKHLPDHKQVAVLGRFELAKKNNLQIHPLEGTELSDLLNMCVKMPDSIKQLGFTSKKQFQKSTGGLVDLRNVSMHPVRSIVNTHSDVEKLARRFKELKNIIAHVERASHCPSP